MRALWRYLRLFFTQVHASLLLMVQYRADLIGKLVLACFWTASALVPLIVLYRQRDSVAGWTWGEALVVVAWFNVLKGVLNSIIQPALTQVVEHVRKGTLDFVLLKPADSQFLVSTTRFELQQLADSVTGFAILGYALTQLGRVPSLGDILATVLLLLCATVILYAIWILVVSLAFVFVKVDNLSYLFQSLYDAARWPSSVFRGAFAVFFTFILPLALMTTYPALAVLGRLRPEQLGLPIGVAIAFFTVARFVWLRAIRGYTSAGG
jgi:ABC-2 type transport system permease protein